MDPVDITPLSRGSINEPMLESINPAGIFMYADIGGMADVGDVRDYLLN